MINLQPDSSRKKEKTQINTIRNEKGEVKADTVEIQRIIGDYYKNQVPIKWTTWKKWTDS